MVIWNSITFFLAIVFALTGISLRRGTNEFFSY
jgi:hypothetical protein